MASLAFALALLATAFPLHSAVAAAAAAAKGFSIELIHRDSPKSPLYDPSATRFDLVTAAARRSAAHAHRISALVSGQTIVSTISPANGEYLMELQLGRPPINIIAIADTGSDLIWTNCQPCDQCYSQIPPLFDPKGSSTYRKVSCGTEACDALPNKACGEGSTCEYHYSYGDRSNVDGVLSADTATFSSATGAKIVVMNVAFGCNSQSRGTFNNRTSGLVGLGAGPLSLVSQISNFYQKTFSYCLVPMISSSSSKISFGEAAVVSGGNAVSTPLKVAKGSWYTLNLEEISVGVKSVDVTSVPPVDSGSGNIIIDSGTTLPHLDSGVMGELVKALEGEVKFPAVSDPTGVGLPACYNISGSSVNNAVFPDITFKFERAAVVLKPLNAFVLVNDITVCLAALTASGGLPQIFGNFAQQNFQVGYNLVANEVSFAPADCTTI